MTIAEKYRTQFLKYIESNDEKNVRAFMANIEDVDTKNIALDLAARNGFVPLVAVLLNEGAEVDYNKNKPLRIAARMGHVGVVQLLIERGANIGAENAGALRWSAEAGHLEVVQVLLCALSIQCIEEQQRICWISEALVHSSHSGMIPVAQMLIKCGAILNSQNGEALYRAVNMRHLEMAKLLVESGAIPTSRILKSSLDIIEEEELFQFFLQLPPSVVSEKLMLDAIEHSFSHNSKHWVKEYYAARHEKTVLVDAMKPPSLKNTIKQRM